MAFKNTKATVNTVIDTVNFAEEFLVLVEFKIKKARFLNRSSQYDIENHVIILRFNVDFLLAKHLTILELSSEYSAVPL